MSHLDNLPCMLCLLGIHVFFVFNIHNDVWLIKFVVVVIYYIHQPLYVVFVSLQLNTDLLFRSVLSNKQIEVQSPLSVDNEITAAPTSFDGNCRE